MGKFILASMVMVGTLAVAPCPYSKTRKCFGSSRSKGVRNTHVEDSRLTYGFKCRQKLVCPCGKKTIKWNRLACGTSTEIKNSVAAAARKWKAHCEGPQGCKQGRAMFNKEERLAGGKMFLPDTPGDDENSKDWSSDDSQYENCGYDAAGEDEHDGTSFNIGDIVDVGNRKGEVTKVSSVGCFVAFENDTEDSARGARTHDGTIWNNEEWDIQKMTLRRMRLSRTALLTEFVPFDQMRLLHSTHDCRRRLIRLARAEASFARVQMH